MEEIVDSGYKAVALGIVYTKIWEDTIDMVEKEGKDREQAWKDYIKSIYSAGKRCSRTRRYRIMRAL